MRDNSQKKHSTQKTRDRVSLFATGFLQVFFVSVNTYFLAKEIYLGVFFAAFMISMIWSYNVSKVVFGKLGDRLTYALGATSGSLFGLWSSSFLVELFMY